MIQEGFYQAKCPKCQGKLTSSARSPATLRQCPYCGYHFSPVKRRIDLHPYSTAEWGVSE